MLRSDLIFLENPFTVKTGEQNIELQKELCDLQFDLFFKTRSENEE